MLRARCFVLAGLYKKERQLELAESFYVKSLLNVGNDKLLRIIAPVIYQYVGCGGRGIDRLLRFLI